MHWIVQDGMYREDGLIELTETLERFGLPYSVVVIDPATGNPVPDIAPDGPVMVCGTYRLSALATRRGWLPGTFLNDQHDHQAWTQAYGQHLLNANALVERFDTLDPPWDPFFVRPCADSKAFSGAVWTRAAFLEWRLSVLAHPDPKRALQADTRVSCAPVQQVYKEARCFVVDSRIITQSIYKMGGQGMADPWVDPEALEFAQQMVQLWQPARAFVLDVGLTDSGWKIVELNCFNCSGFYAANVPKIVAAIEDMVDPTTGTLLPDPTQA